MYLRLLNRVLKKKQNATPAAQYKSNITKSMEALQNSIRGYTAPNTLTFMKNTMTAMANRLTAMACTNQPNHSIHDFSPIIFISSCKKPHGHSHPPHGSYSNKKTDLFTFIPVTFSSTMRLRTACSINTIPKMVPAGRAVSTISLKTLLSVCGGYGNSW